MIGIIRMRWLVCGLLLVVCGSGCLSSSRSDSRHGAGTAGGRKSVVASPLTSQLISPAVLSSVNSLAIEAPAIASAGAAVGITPEDAGAVIERVARQTMTLKVLGMARGGRGIDQSAPSRGADAVLRTEILRFDQRQGSSFGGEPAVVSFRMRLESPGAGAPMWTAQYFLKQEAVSENLLRLGERVGPSGLGAGWRRAEEVFEKGVRDALTELNSQREGQFLTKGRSPSLR